MVQLIPATVVKLWNEWNVRLLVLSSLCLQIVLIIFGKRRKYIARNWIRIVTWTAYLSADWIATLALGMISNYLENDNDPDQQNPPHSNNLIMAAWATFLLVHLSGPDTITAYSLEDNELWLRHLLGLIVQVGGVLYIMILTASTNYHLLFVVPVFVAGVIKYGERTWVLRSASSDKLSAALLRPPNPGKGYADEAEKYSAIKARGEGIGYWTTWTEGLVFHAVNPVIPEARILHEAYELYKILRHLYANLILDYHQRQCCYDMMGDHSVEDVFKQVETELGFMYDMLYTKANVIYSLKGIILRSISLLCYISTLVFFCFVIDKKLYSTIDISLTYVLSVGAILLELYSIMQLISTDWSLLWLSKQKHPVAYPIYKAITSFRSKSFSGGKRWSESIAQFNLIDFCLKEKPLNKCAGIQRALGIYETVEKYTYTSSELVSIKMKQLIYEQLTESMHEDKQVVLTWRGTHTLEKKNCLDKFGWSVVGATLEKSLLMWHIATDLCFYSDRRHQQASSDPESKLMISKLLSDYLMYIVVLRQFMLPKGIWQIRFQDTCAEATNFFENKITRTSPAEKRHARQALLNLNTELNPEIVNGDRSKTVFFQGCRLAKLLMSQAWSHEEKWDMISQVWIEKLCYVASQCGWKEHGQQLRRGGELLTHVCLLMANLGLSEQFQIERGSALVHIEGLPNSTGGTVPAFLTGY